MHSMIESNYKNWFEMEWKKFDYKRPKNRIAKRNEKKKMLSPCNENVNHGLISPSKSKIDHHDDEQASQFGRHGRCYRHRNIVDAGHST